MTEDTIAAGSATEVQATISVPAISIPKLLGFNNTSHASTWVGLTGMYPDNGDKYLAQAGVAIDLTQLNGSTSEGISAFYEYAPDLAFTVQSFPISAGDLVDVTVSISGENQASTNIVDTTAGNKFSTKFAFKEVCGPVSPTCSNGGWALFRTEHQMLNIGTGQPLSQPVPTPNFGAWIFLNPLVTVNASPPYYPGGTFKLNRTGNSVAPCVSSSTEANIPSSWPDNKKPDKNTFIIVPSYDAATNTVSNSFVGPSGGFGYPP